MRKAWFCYEMSATGPAPVIHYDNLPNEKNVLNPKILQKHELGMNWFAGPNEVWDSEVQSSFAILCRHFPYTGDHFDLDDKIKLEAAE